MTKIKLWFKITWLKIKAWFKRLAIAVMMFFGIHAAIAQEVTVSCTAPTEYTDNTPINQDELKIFNIYRDGVNVAQVNDVCLYVESLTPATYKYKVSVTINGIESAQSNEVTKTIVYPTPKAPVLNEID